MLQLMCTSIHLLGTHCYKHFYTLYISIYSTCTSRFVYLDSYPFLYSQSFLYAYVTYSSSSYSAEYSAYVPSLYAPSFVGIYIQGFWRTYNLVRLQSVCSNEEEE